MSGYLPDDCSECDYCGDPVLGFGMCTRCDRELDYIYPRLGLDKDGRDKNGRDRSGLAYGYLKQHGYTASSLARQAAQS